MLRVLRADTVRDRAGLRVLTVRRPSLRGWRAALAALAGWLWIAADWCDRRARG